jgi:hypothetical protein
MVRVMDFDCLVLFDDLQSGGLVSLLPGLAARGELGADVVHHVNATIGSPAGIILWELKRTKAWSDGWLPKLREDQHRCGADVALIISQALPKHIEHFDLVDNVWVAHPRCALPVAVALRQSLIELSNSRFLFSKARKRRWSRSTSI